MTSSAEQEHRPSPAEENFQLVWHNYQSNFHEVVSDLLGSEAFADVSLVAEGRLVRAHRLVLSACSPYLHAVLRALPAAPAAHPVLLLPPEVSLDTLRALLDFMYRGVVHVPHAALVAVLHAGDILQVRGLCRGDDLQRPPETTENSMPASPLQQTQEQTHDVGEPPVSSRRRNRRPASSLVPEGSRDVADTVSEQSAGLALLRVKEEPYDWSTEQLPPPPTPADLETILRPTVLLSTKNEQSEGSRTDHPMSCSDDDEEPTPLTCEQCHEVFPRAAAWVRHLQIHPPSARPPLAPPPTLVARPVTPSPSLLPPPPPQVRRPHVCVHCGKRFSSRASLGIHGRTHTGETPYTCDLCHKGFNVKSNLLRHLRTLHNRMVSPSDVDTPSIS